MAFRSDTAAATLSSVLDELARTWERLSPELQGTLDALIRTHGPQIANPAYDRFNVLSRITALLDALWQLQARLPAQAVRILQAGQAAGASFRGITAVPDAVRAELLQKMRPLADFRVIGDPRRAAAEVDELVMSHQDRLRTEAGADGRASERDQWQAHHAALAVGGDPADYLRKVEALLGGYPAVRQLLEANKLWAPGPTLRGFESTGTPKGPAEPSVDRSFIGAPAAALPAAEEVTRHANVSFPGQVLVTQDNVPLIVHIAGQHAAWASGTADQSRMALQLSDLTVFLHADGFLVNAGIGGVADPANPAIRTVKVERQRDCEPLVFFLKPESLGQKTISLDFRQFGVSIFTSSFTAEVVSEEAGIHKLAGAVLPEIELSSPVRGPAAVPPELELRIILSEDRKTLSYILHAPVTGEYNFQPVGKVTLENDPLNVMQPSFDKLNTWAKRSVTTRSPAETEQVKRQLERMGQDLYEQLFRETPFKTEIYPVIREKYGGKGLLIKSNDLWFPWEMLRPYHDVDGVPVYDDPPLCERFQVSRWFEGRAAPDQVLMKQGVWIVPPDNLQAAQVESDYFVELNRLQWQVALNGPLGTTFDVEDRFSAGETQLFHFACHGNFSATSPDDSKLKLADDNLTPSSLSGRRGGGLRRARPLVFLNACHSGRVGAGLTYLGGWAEAFYTAGVSAFIGSLWEINDALAAQFARAFYDRLWGLDDFAGKAQPLGQAFFEARQVIRDADPANPTWLAYVLYGDPYGQVILGDAVPA
jgi:hypothetical protein